MRVTSFALGIAGGVAGLAVHAVLLAVFFSRSTGLFEVFLQLALAVALGLAAILIAALCRRSLKMLAALLPVLGILGFFPRPVSWSPAGVLLIAGGVVACIALRQAGSRPTAAPAAGLSPTGAPLHWSEAARLGIPATPRVVAPHPRGEERWSLARRTGIIAGGLIAAAIVIPLSVWPPTVAGSAGGQGSVGPTTTVLSARATTTSPQPSSTDSPTSTTAPGHSSTSTTKAGGLDVFSDAQRGISISYPATWRNTNPSEVGERIYGGANQARQRAFNDAYVAAAFADWKGPTYDGCYLDYIWMEVYDDQPTKVSDLPKIRTNVQDYLDWLRQNFSDVKLLEPLREVQIGTATGFDYTWSFTVGQQKLMLTDCVLIANDTEYFLEFASVEKDWKRCHPIFNQILQTFMVRGSSPLA